MAQVPTFLRRWVVLDGPDVDFAATQNVPSNSICTPLSGAVQRIAVNWMPWVSEGVLGNGTINMQLIVADEAQVHQGQTPPTIVMGSEVDAGVAVGEGCVYDVAGCRNITVRMVSTTSNAAYIDIYWRILED